MQLQLLQLATIERNMICFGSLYFVLNRKVRKGCRKARNDLFYNYNVVFQTSQIVLFTYVQER